MGKGRKKIEGKKNKKEKTGKKKEKLGKSKQKRGKQNLWCWIPFCFHYSCISPHHTQSFSVPVINRGVINQKSELCAVLQFPRLAISRY